MPSWLRGDWASKSLKRDSFLSRRAFFSAVLLLIL
jgi:hypothetical protein